MRGRRDQIVGILRGRPAGLSTRDIAVAAGMEQSQASALLVKMFQDGQIQRSKGGGRDAPQGMKERTWRLPPSHLEVVS